MTSFARRARQVVDEPAERFGLLLVLLVLSFLVSGIEATGRVRALVGILNLLAVVVGFSSLGIRANIRILAAVVVAGALGSLLVSSFRGDAETTAGAWLQAVVLAVLTVAVLGRIIRHETVTGQTLLGAMAVYFLIGQLFAWTYFALPGYGDGDVIANVPVDEIPMYYSYVVLTTLGFGDVLPVGALAERVTVIEALFGQLFLATFLARLVSLFSRHPASGTDIDGG